MKEYVPIVNDKDKIIATSDIKTVHAKGLLHREAYVYIISKDKVLLQKRKNNRKWDHSSAGHFGKNETYLQGARRETREELGISLPQQAFREIAYLRRRSRRKASTNNRFIRVFLVKKEIPLKAFNIQKTEVEEVRYFHKKEITRLMRTEPMTGSAKYLLRKYILKEMG